MNANDNQKHRYPMLEVGCLLIILGIAGYLRLANLTMTPNWYTDEGTHINIAQNLLNGKVQYLAVNQSVLMFGRLPLFEIMLAGALFLIEDGMMALRCLTGALGVISVGVLYGAIQGLTRYVSDKQSPLALLAALFYAVYPPAVLYSRFGFSYNLLTPLVLLTFLGLGKYLVGKPIKWRWLLLATCAIGIGSISDLWMFTLVVPMGLIILVRNWRHIWWSMLVTFLPFGLYAITMLIIARQPFLFDLAYTFGRITQLSLMEQITTLVQNLTVLSKQDYWVIPAVIGLLLLPSRPLRYLSLLFFLFPVLSLGRTVALFSLSFYYMIPLLPFIAFGMAAFTIQIVSYLLKLIYAMQATLLDRLGQSTVQQLAPWIRPIFPAIGLIIILLFLIPLVFTPAATGLTQVHQGFQTHIDPFLVSPPDGYQAAQYINQHTQSDDLVIASPGLAWLFEVNTADFQMSAAIDGQETVHMPANIPQSRFAFDTHYRQARYVVIDSLWHNWAIWHVVGVSEMMAHMANWSLVFEAGDIDIYCNSALYEDCD